MRDGKKTKIYPRNYVKIFTSKIVNLDLTGTPVSIFVKLILYLQLNRIGPKIMFNGGIFTVGICAILFGLLDRVEGHYPFIILSFLIRIVEAMGNAAFLTASFAIIAKEFPDNIATTFVSYNFFF